ncbi:MAG: DNA polymerase/3'-5' exonuclease PolX [Elusimicrobia bacterium]|nr:DNA polymerase/3'-5' exonuclease PolX [Elusimicrobiota bacterium]MBD3411757.1 DNA polymerase/3'-5' exonuclease PolX [Elusimicrobiota bacterium]
MDNKEISAVLEEIATILEFINENPFKVRAYQNAARVIASTDQNLTTLVNTNQLKSLKGIGSGIAEKITELVTTGSLPYYEELKKKMPPGFVEMLGIPSLGPKKAKKLHDMLHITTLGELEYACKENRLVDIEGFGKKTQEKILSGIEYIKKTKNLHRLDTAYDHAHELLRYFKNTKHLTKLSLAGSIRRFKEVVKDIDLVGSASDPERVMKEFVSNPAVETVIAHGTTKSSVRLSAGINADLRLVSDKEFPYALHHFTGSKEHNIAMRTRAKSMGITMNEYGLFKKNRLIACKTETDVFKHLGLDYIEPELRENTGEIQAAESHTLPDLLTEKDITGIFHVHTAMSDGEIPLQAMVEAVKKKGYQYVGISDHSQSAFYAHGLKQPDLHKQHTQIEQLNKQMKNFVILKGIESDILPDGSLDYPDSVLEKFDFVIGSVHSKFSMNEQEMTKRLIKAMKNKYLTMLGHLTGRLLLAREAYPVNHRDVIQAASDYGVIIELNANPYRLDIDWRHLKHVKEKEVLISINPDAHDTDDLDYIRYGVGIARKGWLSKIDVFNTRSIGEIRNYLSNRR